MKVLLIQPPVEDFYQTAQRIEPIGLAYLAACLQERGFSPQILDCQANRKKYILDLPPSLQYLKDFYLPGNLSPFKLFGHYYHFGLSPDEIEMEIRKSEAHAFGISSMFSTYHHQALLIAERIKKVDGKNIVILGGAHASSNPSEVLDSPWVDYVILGEGKESFPRLLECVKQGDLSGVSTIDGIGYREKGSIKIHPKTKWVKNLDSLPHPARELLQANAYRIGGRRSTKILASRGCPCRCSFCSVHIGMGARFRPRSAEKILEEMAYCNEKLAIEAFDFEDGHLGYDKKIGQVLSISSVPGELLGKSPGSFF